MIKEGTLKKYLVFCALKFYDVKQILLSAEKNEVSAFRFEGAG